MTRSHSFVLCSLPFQIFFYKKCKKPLVFLYKKPQMYLPAYNLAHKSHIMNMVGKTRSEELEKNTLLSCERYFFLNLGLLAFKRAASAQGGDRSRPNCMLATRACRREESVIRGRGLLKFPLAMDIINI